MLVWQGRIDTPTSSDRSNRTGHDAEAGEPNTAHAEASVGDAGMDDNGDCFGASEPVSAGKGVRANGDGDIDRIVGALEVGAGAASTRQRSLARIAGEDAEQAGG